MRRTHFASPFSVNNHASGETRFTVAEVPIHSVVVVE